MANFVSKMVKGDGALVMVVDEGQGSYSSVTVTTGDRCYHDVKEAFKAGNADVVMELIRKPAPSLEELVSGVASQVGEVTIDNDGNVLVDGEYLHDSVAECIKDLYLNDFDTGPMVNFLKKVLKSTSYRVRNELWTFIEKCGLTITEDGCFLAYKSVSENYLDKHSGKFDNRPGTVNEMPRHKVDDDCNVGCSYGFHVGALSYAGPGGYFNEQGDKVLVCKVDPVDVISVPKDCSCQKLRCCKYVVVSDFKGELNRPLYSGKVSDEDYDDDNYDDEDEDEDEEDLILNVDEMLIGEAYSFTYEKRDGSCSTRHAIVEEIDPKSILTELIDPEENSGEYRRFNKDFISNVTYYGY